jgi:hypothetical protein
MAVTLNPAEAPSWYQFVTNFDAAYAQFYDNYNALMAIGPWIQQQHPELLTQYMTLLQDGSNVAYQLEGLKATRNYVYSWLNYLSSGVESVMQGAQSAYDYARKSLGLGAVPVAVVVIGLAAATAVIVAAENWLGRANEFAQVTNFIRDQEAKGVTPDQASKLAQSVFGSPPSNEFLGIPWTLLVWGAIAIFLGPPILKAIEGRK